MANMQIFIHYMYVSITQLTGDLIRLEHFDPLRLPNVVSQISRLVVLVISVISAISLSFFQILSSLSKANFCHFSLRSIIIDRSIWQIPASVGYTYTTPCVILASLQ